MSVRPWLLVSGYGLLATWGIACAAPAVPDPAPRVRAYQAAVRRGDAKAIYAMLSRADQQALGPGRVAELLRENRQELEQQAERIGESRTRVQAVAEIRFVDGQTIELAVEDGEYRVTSAAALPAQAATPEQALAELRTVLLRRSYSALLRVLTAEAAGGLEDKVGSLVRGLEHPNQLDVRVQGDRAHVVLEGGHRVELEREDGIWKVRDFE